MISGSLVKRATFLLVNQRLRKTQADILLVGLAVNSGSDGERGWVVERSSISTERWMLPRLQRFLLKNTDKYGRPPPWYVCSRVCLVWNLVKWTVLKRDMANFPPTFPVRIPLAVVRLLMYINRWAGYAWTTYGTWCLKHAMPVFYGPWMQEQEAKVCIKGSESHWPILPCFWQYGFVNHALELLVLRNYGPEVWEDIKWVWDIKWERNAAVRETDGGQI